MSQFHCISQHHVAKSCGFIQALVSENQHCKPKSYIARTSISLSFLFFPDFKSHSPFSLELIQQQFISNVANLNRIQATPKTMTFGMIWKALLWEISLPIALFAILEASVLNYHFYLIVIPYVVAATTNRGSCLIYSTSESIMDLEI